MKTDKVKTAVNSASVGAESQQAPSVKKSDATDAKIKNKR